MDSSSDEELLIYYLRLRRRRKHIRRKMWVREIFLCRKQLGEFHHLVPQLKNDPEKFYSYYRMNIECYNNLRDKLKLHILNKQCKFRERISFEERLTVTLRYLATGDSFHSASFRFRIAHNTISKIVTEILQLICETLHNDYLKCPNKDGFKVIADSFKEKKHFPNCLGAIDGKHVRIKKPVNAGSLYYNYKLYHSIILLAVVDANYNFTMIDVGSYGKNSDGGVFEHSVIGRMMNNNQLQIPDDKPIELNGPLIPYVFVADEAFKLTKNIMKPYPRRDLNAMKRVFNYRLSHARQMVECAFGILAAKFRVFTSEIAIEPKTVDKLIIASCILHNMIRKQENNELASETATPHAFTNIQQPLINNRRSNNNQSTREARQIRENFAIYFSGAGATTWQAAYVNYECDTLDSD